MTFISDSLNRIKPSATMVITAKATQLKREGKRSLVYHLENLILIHLIMLSKPPLMQLITDIQSILI